MLGRGKNSQFNKHHVPSHKISKPGHLLYSPVPIADTVDLQFHSVCRSEIAFFPQQDKNLKRKYENVETFVKVKQSCNFSSLTLEVSHRFPLEHFSKMELQVDFCIF